MSDAQALLRGVGIVFRELGVSDLAARYTCVAYFLSGESGHFAGCVVDGSSVRIYDDSRRAEISLTWHRFRGICGDAPARVFLMGRPKSTVVDTELYEDRLGGGGGRVRYSTLARCVSGCGGSLVPDAKRLAQPAHVWAGPHWRVVKHRRKQRRRCRTSYRPNWRWVGEEKFPDPGKSRSRNPPLYPPPLTSEPFGGVGAARCQGLPMWVVSAFG